MVEINIPEGANRAELYDKGPLADDAEMSGEVNQIRCTLFFAIPGRGRTDQYFFHFEVEDLAQLHSHPPTREEAIAAFDRSFTKLGWESTLRGVNGDVVAAWELH
jgi:hypothetical protein